MTQDKPSLLKFERRPIWQKKTMSLAHKLSMQLRAAEDRTQQMAGEVEHWRDRAARAEQWLRTIQQEIEEKLLTRRSVSGGEEVAIR